MGDRREQNSVVMGLVLITIGVIFLGGRQQWGPEWRMETLWPLILIVFGLGRIIAPRYEGRRSSGFWILLTGVLFLLNQLHVVRFEQTWPLFIVLGGLSILIGGGRRRDRGESKGN